MKRWVLLNPGPVNVTEGVRRALLGPDLCHREPEFSRLFRDVRSKLLKAFGIQRSHEAALFTGSGTSAVEAMLSSYGGKTLVLSNGVYGERMAAILKAHGRTHRVLAAALTQFPELGAIENILRSDRSITAVAMVHHETSTGMLNPLAAIARLAKKYKKAVLVDAVSSLGAEIIDLKDVDFLAGSSGKCLHAFPGVSFVFVSKTEAAQLPKDKKSVYLDLRTSLESARTYEPPFTPAVQLYYAFDRALDELLKQGVKHRIETYARKMALVEEGLLSSGARFLVEKKYRSHVLLSARLPEGLSYERLHDEMKKKGFVIYAGQSALKKTIFRVSCLGEVSENDLRRFAAVYRQLAGKPKSAPKAIVLAAGVGKRFGARTKALPKCLIPLGNSGETLLKRYLDAFRENNIKEAVIVVGHEKNQIIQAAKKHGAGLKIRFVTNREYRKGSVLSLHTAGKYLNSEVIVMDADVFFPAPMLGRLLEGWGSVFLLDEHAKENGEEMMLRVKNGRALAITKPKVPGLKPIGEATGIVKFSKTDAIELRKILNDFARRKNDLVEYEDAYCKLLQKRKIGWVPTQGYFWTEMDFEEDLQKISDHLKS